MTDQLMAELKYTEGLGKGVNLGYKGGLKQKLEVLL